MKRIRYSLLLALLFAAVPAARAGDGLPGEAAALVRQFQQDAAAIQARADGEVGARREKLLQDLGGLRDSYAKAGRYDEALAVHGLLRSPPSQCVAVHGLLRSPPSRCVEVLWGGTWWPAEILGVRGGLSYIHYTGWADSWNEWVTRDRIRPAAGGGPPAPCP
jgi:hypothetical protein